MQSTDVYFYTKDKELYTKFTKQEINKLLKPFFKYETCADILQDLDYPYIEAEIRDLITRYPENWFGRYLSKMDLRGFRDYRFKDSAFLNFCDEKRRHKDAMKFINWFKETYNQEI